MIFITFLLHMWFLHDTTTKCSNQKFWFCIPLAIMHYILRYSKYLSNSSESFSRATSCCTIWGDGWIDRYCKDRIFNEAFSFVWRRVHNILSPFRNNRKPFIFLWKFTLRNAGIGSGSNPAFHTLKNQWLRLSRNGDDIL